MEGSMSKDQLEVLVLCLLGNQVGQVFHDVGELKIDHFNGQLARIDLGYVQDVVDDVQEVLTGRVESS